MKVKSKWELFKIIGKSYALEILDDLFENPKRYTDIDISTDKTKTKRLKELKRVGLIETETREFKEKDRIFICYKLTKKGKNLIQTISKIVL